MSVMGLPKFSHHAVSDQADQARNTKSVALVPTRRSRRRKWPALHVQMIERTCVGSLLVHAPHDQRT